MIAAILEDFLGRPVAGFRTLDIGCGNGIISAYFAARNEHFAVDVSDQRREKSGSFEFRLVTSERLPFGEGFFDVVISHHVIEHLRDQGLHLSESRRVLKADGVLYLATPNRSSPIMRGHVGNERVLRYSEMGPLLRAHGFELREYGLRVAKAPQRFHGETKFARFLPTTMLKVLRPLYPSHMFVAWKARRSGEADANSPGILETGDCVHADA